MSPLLQALLFASIVYVSGQNCPGTKMTPQYRATVLKSHNDYRSTIAKGTAEMLGGGYARRGKNVYKMTYNCDLEKRAQEWADRCVYKHSANEWRYDAGENLWVTFATYELKIGDDSMTGASDYWWNELKKYGIIDNSYQYSSSMSPIGHWTQMIWANTTELGCGVASCPWMTPGWQHNIYVVCHYRDAGNWRGRQIYEFGDGCSRDSDCTKYSGSTCESSTNLCLKPGQKPDGKPQPKPEPPKPTRAPAPRPTAVPKPDLKPKPEESCKSQTMTTQLRQYILGSHNKFRSEVANGRAANRRAGKNIYKLKYDCGLEAEAQALADRCDIENTPRGNMYYDGTASRPKTALDAFKTAIKSWSGAINKKSLTDYKFSQSTPNELLAFTQMVWGSSTKIGCGIAMDCNLYYQGQYYKGVVLVCLYSERGNIFGKQIYELGDPCKRNSDCTTFPNSKCAINQGICVAP